MKYLCLVYGEESQLFAMNGDDRRKFTFGRVGSIEVRPIRQLAGRKL
jgi:hypothetical protein